MRYDDLNDNNFAIFAAKHYHNHKCIIIEEFQEDLNRFKYIKRLVNRYLESGKDVMAYIRKQDEQKYKDIVLAGALGKIDDAMSGIMSTVRGGFDDGGSANKPKDPATKQEVEAFLDQL